MLVRSLDELTAADTADAGGKGANLGELRRAEFPVPDGFVITTASYALAAEAAGVTGEAPATARVRLAASPVPAGIAHAVREAYRALGASEVAVRSSATAEARPEARFAGQQDTMLGVSGEDAVLDAVRRCWASLWNDRAVAYRQSHDVPAEGLRLAVVVQRMVDAESAGVLFTADPITGRRRRATIEAVRGLGEQLVSGAVNPDHFVVNTRSDAVLERRGDILTDAQLRELAALGARIEDHFGRPQDIEWAIDRAGKLWIVQSRDITTLYPLPPPAPDDENDLRVYFSANVAQGVFDPFTPMGLQTFRLLSSAFATAFGRPVRDPAAGASIYAESGMRVFIDLTPVLRDPFGREVPPRVMSVMEFRSKAIFTKLLDDPRLRPRGSASRSRLLTLAAALRTGAPQSAVRTMLRPDATRKRVLAELDRAIASVRIPETSAQRLDAYEQLILTFPPRFFPRLVGIVIPGVLSYALAGRVLGGRARPGELQTVLRGLPHNPTTEMDLALWEIAHAAREDPASRVHGPRRAILRFLLGRVRLLGGLREQPKFQIMRVFALGHALIAPVGGELVERGLLDVPDDAFFLTLPELRRAIAGEDLRGTVVDRRALYRREQGRRHVPRVLLSDGTDAETEIAAPTDGAIRGTPASPGIARGIAHVIRSPVGARLEPGEVLVAPSTDPGWTPLFLTAGALVMEMGGMMSHGAVVAREYGIPAVVGVVNATGRITTGDQVTVDGSAGTVALGEPAG